MQQPKLQQRSERDHKISIGIRAIFQNNGATQLGLHNEHAKQTLHGGGFRLKPYSIPHNPNEPKNMQLG